MGRYTAGLVKRYTPSERSTGSNRPLPSLSRSATSWATPCLAIWSSVEATAAAGSHLWRSPLGRRGSGAVLADTLIRASADQNGAYSSDQLAPGKYIVMATESRRLQCRLYRQTLGGAGQGPSDGACAERKRQLHVSANDSELKSLFGILRLQLFQCILRSSVCLLRVRRLCFPRRSTQ